MHVSIPDENTGNTIFSCKFPSIAPLRPSGTPDFAGKVSHWIFARLRLPTARLSATHDNLRVASLLQIVFAAVTPVRLLFPPGALRAWGGGLCRVISTSCGYSHWDSNGGGAAVRSHNAAIAANGFRSRLKAPLPVTPAVLRPAPQAGQKLRAGTIISHQLSSAPWAAPSQGRSLL